MSSLLKKLDWPLSLILLPICFIVNRILSFFHQPSGTLIIRPGGLGDLILLTLSRDELSLQDRSCLWIIERRSQVWAEYLGLNYSCFDDVSGKNLIKLISLISSFARVINTEQFYALSQVLSLLLAHPKGKTLCFQSNRLGSYATETVAYDWDGSHEVGEFKKLLIKAFELKYFTLSSIPVKRVKRLPESGQSQAKEDLVNIVWISGRQSPSKNLSENAWIDLIHSWSNQKNFTIMAEKKDLEFAKSLAQKFSPLPSILTGNFSTLLESFLSCDELLTVDGASVHLASYSGLPCTAVFTSGRYKKWFPLTEGSFIIKREDLACQPCAKFGEVPDCERHFECKNVSFSMRKSIATLF